MFSQNSGCYRIAVDEIPSIRKFHLLPEKLLNQPETCQKKLLEMISRGIGIRGDHIIWDKVKVMNEH